MVSSTDFVRASERTTAIATLNRQRHLTPSCGGFTPTAERTVGPARMIVESLTPRPGIREQIGTFKTCPTYPAMSPSRGGQENRRHDPVEPTRMMLWTAPLCGIEVCHQVRSVERRPTLREPSMGEVGAIGLDIAKVRLLSRFTAQMLMARL